MLSQKEECLSRYLKELSGIAVLSNEEETRLARQIREGDLAAKEKLIKANLRFVVSCAKKYQHVGMQVSDLVNEGNLGLIRAAEVFDGAMGFRFISFAVWWIRQSMLLAIGRDNRTIRLPMHIIKMNAQVNRTNELLEQRLQRQPTTTEVAAELGINAKDLSFVQGFTGRVASLNAKISEESTLEVWEAIGDNSTPSPDHTLESESDSDLINRMLDLIDTREREILSSYFGLEGKISLSYEDIAKKYGITGERVRQLKERAFQKIRKAKDRAVKDAEVQFAQGIDYFTN